MSKLEDVDPVLLANALYSAIDAFGLILVPNRWTDIETDCDDVAAIARRVTGHDDEGD